MGDYVFFKQPKTNKLTANYNKTPYIVIYRNKTVVTARSENRHEIQRNVSHFKKIPKPNIDDESDDVDDKIENKPAQSCDEQRRQNTDHGNDGHLNLKRSTRKQPERYGQHLPLDIIS